jgi:uncharacterized membrane protein YiaA
MEAGYSIGIIIMSTSAANIQNDTLDMKNEEMEINEIILNFTWLFVYIHNVHTIHILINHTTAFI